MLGGVMLWTMLYSRHGQKQRDEAKKRRLAHEAEATNGTTDNIIA